MIFLNEQGVLSPNSTIRCTAEDLFFVFVEPFSASSTRSHLFRQWQTYNRLLRQEIGTGFVQWVNGSFVTMKADPEDIDIVSFIPSILFRKFENRLDHYWSDSWEREGIDAYLVEVLSSSDPNYTMFKNTSETWHKLYTRTKLNSIPPDTPKGYLIINIE